MKDARGNVQEFAACFHHRIHQRDVAMSSGTSSLPLLPPPPPSPPPQSSIPAPVALNYLPADCRPKVDALVHLILNIDSDKCFDPDERRQLRNSNVGNDLVQILQQCRDYRETFLASKKLLEQQTSTEQVSRAAKQAHEHRLLDLQTCLMRASCPMRMQLFQKCLAGVDQNMLRKFRNHHGLSRFICQSERQSLERCTGNLVSQSVRAAIEDPFEES